VSVTLPAVGHVIEATADRPYLCLRLELDARLIGELMLQVGRNGVPPSTDRGLFVARTSPQLLDAVVRLTRLLEQPLDAAILAPLVMREIHYRVLTGELGHRLRELCIVDSQTHRIARAIELLRRRFTETLRIEDLAAAAHMSESSLHHRFKAVTAMSPMQFQKQLRLHEARRLMLTEGLEAAAAAHRVGYESPSQFSREYRRLFGAPPRREIQIVRSATAQPA
jgi:AraC-like DNA-binding protein